MQVLERARADVVTAAELLLVLARLEADGEVAGAIVDDEVLHVEAAALVALPNPLEVGLVGIVAGAEHDDVHLGGDSRSAA